uniref:MYND-type domain-containing protein n=1 Tax=Mycena chlorophos TaxID=658473 RepID=A0ABQ0L2U2_MYCCL|nr:predicted protein [Mycena chlorophos]
MAPTDYPSSRFIFVDTVDMDNPLLCLSQAKGNPNAFIHIILSTPKPAHRLATPLDGDDPDWAAAVPDELKDYFKRDARFGDVDAPYLLEDLELYMQLSAFRFTAILVDSGVSRDRFGFYQASWAHQHIVPGIRHAMHVPDYTYDFDADEKAKFDAVYTTLSGDALREKLLDVCRDYVSRQSTRFGIPLESTGIFTDFDTLLDQESLLDQPAEPRTMVIGGPLTEALPFLRRLRVRRIFAMLLCVHGDLNVFPEQYNVLLDRASCTAFLDLVQARGIPMRIVPTELVKGSPLQLTADELGYVFAPAPRLLEMVLAYTHGTQIMPGVALFDWVMGILERHPEWVPTRRVVWYHAQVKGQRVIRVRDVGPAEESCLEMYEVGAEALERTFHESGHDAATLGLERLRGLCAESSGDVLGVSSDGLACRLPLMAPTKASDTKKLRWHKENATPKKIIRAAQDKFKGACATCKRFEDEKGCPIKLYQCAKCSTAMYCSKEVRSPGSTSASSLNRKKCQKSDWKAKHKYKCRGDDSSLPTPKILVSLVASKFIARLLQMCLIHAFDMCSLSSEQLTSTPFVALCDLSTEPLDRQQFADLLVALADKDSDAAAALPPALTSIRAAPLVSAFSTVWSGGGEPPKGLVTEGIIEFWKNAREECLPLTGSDLPIGIIMFAKAHTPLNFGLMPLPIMPPTLELLRSNMENPTLQVPLDLSDAIGPTRATNLGSGVACPSWMSRFSEIWLK